MRRKKPGLPLLILVMMMAAIMLWDGEPANTSPSFPRIGNGSGVYPKPPIPQSSPWRERALGEFFCWAHTITPGECTGNDGNVYPLPFKAWPGPKVRGQVSCPAAALC